MFKDIHLDEFYIGYLREAPQRTSRVIKSVVAGIAILVVFISVVLVLNQRKFASTRFDYGVYTTVEGSLFTKPIPHLVVNLGEASEKKIVQYIVLVGFGKSSARGLIKQLEKKEGQMLEGATVTLTGNLIYGNGKTLLQVEEGTNNLSIVEASSIAPPAYNRDNDTRIIQGEIVDPKCFFGVMKPAEGKPHRSCAIRCLSGGIPAAFHSTSDEYFVLLDENFEPFGDEILTVVGDFVTLQGESITWGDWNIFRVNKKDLRVLSAKKQREKSVLAFESGMTKCQ